MLSLAGVAGHDRFSAVAGERPPMGVADDLLGPFDAADVASVADDAPAEVAAADVRAALRAHQRLVRDLRSVDGLVFEYRKEFAHDPVVARDGEAYYLRVPSRVWPEFGTALELGAAVFAAVRAVHERTVAGVVDADDPGSPVPEDARDAMVLVRE